MMAALTYYLVDVVGTTFVVLGAAVVFALAFALLILALVVLDNVGRPSGWAVW